MPRHVAPRRLAAALAAAAFAAPGSLGLGGRCLETEPFAGDGVAALCEARFPKASDFAPWVVHFYGRECRHCRDAAHALRAAAELGRRGGGRARLREDADAAALAYGAVDCHLSENHRLCKAHGVWKLPVIRALGPSASYAGPMEPEAIHAWAVATTNIELLRRRGRRGRSPPAPAGPPALCPAHELYDEPRAAREFLRAHNVYRCMAGLRLLSWDARAFRTARRYAEIAPMDRLQHSPEAQRRGPSGAVYGENVAIGEPRLEPGVVVARWYSEIRSTHGGRGGAPRPGQTGIGHYTQIVWRGTTRVGCSFGQGRRVAICHYDPSGNVRGRHLSQIAPPLPGYEGLEGELRCGGPVDEITL